MPFLLSIFHFMETTRTNSAVCALVQLTKSLNLSAARYS